MAQIKTNHITKIEGKRLHANLPSFFPQEVLPEHQSQHPYNLGYGKHTYL